MSENNKFCIVINAKSYFLSIMMKIRYLKHTLFDASYLKLKSARKIKFRQKKTRSMRVLFSISAYASTDT